MAAAAAAAATVAQAIQVQCGKHLVSNMTTVKPLKDSVDYIAFREQLERASFASSWSPWLLDNAHARPTVLTPKEVTDEKNAYTLLMSKTDGSPAEHLLRQIARGDAKAGFTRLDNHFNRPTVSGRSHAMTNFHTASMKSTGSDITQWYSTVIQRARSLNNLSPGAATPETQTYVLYAGLLDEFKPIKTVLMLNLELTVHTAYNALYDFAVDNGIDKLTHGSNKNPRSNTFVLNDKPNKLQHEKVQDKTHAGEPCRQWARGMCRYKEKGCIYSHDGPGGFIKGNKPSVFTTSVKTVQAKQNEADNVTTDASSCPPLAGVFHVNSEPNSETLESLACSNVFLQYSEDHTADAPDLVSISDDSDPTSTSDDSSNSPDEVEPADVCRTHSHAPPRRNKIADTLMMLFTIMSAVTSGLVYLFWDMGVASGKALIRRRPSVNNIMKFAGSTVCLIMMIAILANRRNGATAEELGHARPNHFLSTSHTKNASVSSSVYMSSANSSGSNLRRPARFQWCADSGANRFVTNDASDFQPESVRIISTTVSVGGGTTEATKQGDVLIYSPTHDHMIRCSDVLFLPNCATKIMPVSAFARKGCAFSILPNGTVTLQNNKVPLLVGREFDGLYYYDARALKPGELRPDDTANRTEGIPVAAPSNPHQQPQPSVDQVLFGLEASQKISPTHIDFSQKLLDAHCSYGHLNFNSLRKILGLKAGDNPDCASCAISKSKAESLSKHVYTRSPRPCHRMHMDLGFTSGSQFVFQLFVDDHTRVSYLEVIDDKSCALDSWTRLKAHQEIKCYPLKFAIIRTDSEPLYHTPLWDAHVADNDMDHEASSRYRHDQHGVAERTMQTIGTSYRSMMIHGNAPDHESPYALDFANTVRNHSPTRANNGRSPREKEAGRKLPVNRRLLRGPLFCLVFAHIYEEEPARTKHAPRGVPCVYLGYDDVNNTYLVREWISGQVYYTADLTFHPHVFPYRTNREREATRVHQYDDAAPTLTMPSQIRIPAPPRPKSRRQRDYLSSGGVDINSIPDSDSPPTSVSTNDSSANVTWAASTFLVHTFGPDPLSAKEASEMYDATDWAVAELKEKASLKFHDVYDVVPRTEPKRAGKRIFGAKPVYKRKILPPTVEQPGGVLDKHKLRMTIAAFTKMLR